jgi:hypothetical protein
MAKINCWLCRNPIELGEGIGYYFDVEMNLRCEQCELPICPATEDAELELQKFTDPVLKSSFSAINYSAGFNNHNHNHNHNQLNQQNIPLDENGLTKRHPFHKNGQFGPLGEEWSGYDGG